MTTTIVDDFFAALGSGSEEAARELVAADATCEAQEGPPSVPIYGRFEGYDGVRRFIATHRPTLAFAEAVLWNLPRTKSASWPRALQAASGDRPRELIEVASSGSPDQALDPSPTALEGAHDRRAAQLRRGRTRPLARARGRDRARAAGARARARARNPARGGSGLTEICGPKGAIMSATSTTGRRWVLTDLVVIRCGRTGSPPRARTPREPLEFPRFSLRQPPALLLAMICSNIAVRAGALMASPSRIATVRAVLLSWPPVMIFSGSGTIAPS